jgi:hypothetical protein
MAGFPISGAGLSTGREVDKYGEVWPLLMRTSANLGKLIMQSHLGRDVSICMDIDLAFKTGYFAVLGVEKIAIMIDLRGSTCHWFEIGI